VQLLFVDPASHNANHSLRLDLGVPMVLIMGCEVSPPVSQIGSGSYVPLTRAFLGLPLGWAKAANSFERS
jgi:hypothetical protein